MQRARVRPDPVSCQSCRSKKLKCNRVQPCSNCTARGIHCKFLVRPGGQTTTIHTSHSNTELLERIAKLESIVLKQTDSNSAETRSCSTSDTSIAARQQLPSLSPESITVSNIHRKREQESRLLENVGTREDSLLPRLSSGIVFRIGLQYPIEISEVDRSSDTIATFPTYPAATLFLQSYQSNVDHLCRILHIPTVRSLMKNVYLRIPRNEYVSPGQAALLLSIFAISAYFYQPHPDCEIAKTKEDAIHLSKSLSRRALDVLDYSRRNTSGTLEDAQAYILMALVAYHLDGFSARGRMLSTAAVSIARELRLHRLDADESSMAENETTISSLIDREVKRRVFWHIATSDWLLSTISGPQEGTYFINPSHIRVKLPKDSTDDDLFLSSPSLDPLPTGMSFFLSRLHLAHLCREITDALPLETSQLLQISYTQIISLDQKIQNFISSLPFFFKVDPESRAKSKELETIYSKLPILRYCITTEAHSRRFKLHQKFLLRQSNCPDYIYSRNACLESARAVVQVFEDLKTHDSPCTELMGMAVHFTHLALVVMAMDLCFNRDAADAAVIKAEVREALKMFEDATYATPLLERFLGSLREVLGRYGVVLDDSASDRDEQMQTTQQGLDQSAALPMDISFDDFWQIAMQGDQNPDSLTWDNLFSALDCRPL